SGGAGDDVVADVSPPQLLRLGRKGKKRVALVLNEEIDRLNPWGRDYPVDVPAGIDADIRRHRGQKQMRRAAHRRQRDLPALEVGDLLDALVSKQAKAAALDAGKRPHPD